MARPDIDAIRKRCKECYASVNSATAEWISDVPALLDYVEELERLLRDALGWLDVEFNALGEDGEKECRGFEDKVRLLLPKEAPDGD